MSDLVKQIEMTRWEIERERDEARDRVRDLEARCWKLETQSTEERRLYEEAFDAMLKQQSRCGQLESALRDCLARWDYLLMPTTPEPPVFDMERIRKLLKPASAENVSAAHPSLAPDAVTGKHPRGGPCIHVWALTNRSAIKDGKCEICSTSAASGVTNE